MTPEMATHHHYLQVFRLGKMLVLGLLQVAHMPTSPFSVSVDMNKSYVSTNEANNPPHTYLVSNTQQR
jgi:hypothetical protein